MRPIPALLPLVVSIAGVSFVVGLMANKAPITIVETPNIALDELTSRDWKTACFAPAYHFDVRSSVRNQCRGDGEVPYGWTYLTFYDQDGSCERFGFEADFLIPHGADYRCFSATAAQGTQIRTSNGILRLH